MRTVMKPLFKLAAFTLTASLTANASASEWNICPNNPRLEFRLHLYEQHKPAVVTYFTLIPYKGDLRMVDAETSVRKYASQDLDRELGRWDVMCIGGGFELRGCHDRKNRKITLDIGDFPRFYDRNGNVNYYDMPMLKGGKYRWTFCSDPEVGYKKLEDAINADPLIRELSLHSLYVKYGATRDCTNSLVLRR